MNLAFVRGSHYQNPPVYKFLTALKLRKSYGLRYRLAARYLVPGEAVLDVCAGLGEFKRFLPAGSSYRALEASRPFLRKLERQGIPSYLTDLHKDNGEIPVTDTIVMIISLYQFRDTTLHQLLETFKTKAKKVIIIEETAPVKRNPLLDRLANYLCAADYFRPTRLFTANEFSTIIAKHGYNCLPHNDRYCVGYYER